MAWAELVAAHGDFVRRFARRVLREPAASDVADQVIADLWLRRNIARYEGRSSLRTWLGSIVAHAAINASHSARRSRISAKAAVGSRPIRASWDTGEMARSDGLGGLIASSIAQQPPADRLLVLLYYDRSMTLEEISRVMGLSKAALSRRLKRIRRDILARLDAAARRQAGASARSLVDGLDIAEIDFDLRAACGFAAQARTNDQINRASA